MILALVKGRATATVKHPSLNGQKLLVCLTIDAAGNAGGDPILVVDRLGAGRGDVVMVSSDGEGVRELLNSNTSPARWFTLGIVEPVAATVKG